MAKEMKIVQNVIAGGKNPMPQAEDGIEEAVIGAILIETSTARRVIPAIKEDYFYKAPNKLIFMSCRDLFMKDTPIDILTVVEEMRAQGTLEAVGGPFYVTQLSSRVASSAHIDEHIAILASYYTRRKLREILMEADRNAEDMTIDVYDTLVSANKALSQLANDLPEVNQLREMPEVMEKMMLMLAQRMDNSDHQLTGIDTGLIPLNELLLGWQKGTVNVIAARTGEGKTAFLMHTLLAAARQGMHVCLISMESNAERLAERWILGATNISPDAWSKGELNTEQLAEVEAARKDLEKLEIRTFDRGHITMEAVCMMVKALFTKGKCHMLGIDYIQLFRDPRNQNREQDVASNSRLLKQLSLQLDIPIIVLSQLNREVKANPDQVPALENIRESGSIEQDADTVSLIYHPAAAGLAIAPGSKFPVSPDMMMLIVAKNRNGAPGTVYLSHNPSMTKFTEFVPSTDWIFKQPTTTVKDKGKWEDSDPEFQAFLQAKKKEKDKKESEGNLPF